MTPPSSYHPLLMGAPSKGNPDGVIRVMADHGHEGVLVTIQDSDDESEWPKSVTGFQAKPVVVAYGINKDTGKPIALISAYDGQSAGVGRIVAHTTWHHFVNVNLHGFQIPEASDTWAALSQYYINLAWWLKPNATRHNALTSTLRALVTNRNVRDLNGAPLPLLGRAAYELLSTVATKGQIQDMIYLAVEELIAPKHSRSTMQCPLPNAEYLLGGMVAEQQQAQGSNVKGKEDDLSTTLSVAARGIKRALQTRIQNLEVEIKTFADLLE